MQQNQTQDTLRLRRVAIDTYKENVAFLNGDCEIYRAEGFQALSKIKVTINGNSILAVLNVVHDDTIVTPGELGLSEQAFEQLGEEEAVLVRVDHAAPPHSLDAVRRKIAGERLSAEDYYAITRDIGEHRYSKTEMTAFYLHFLHPWSRPVVWLWRRDMECPLLQFIPFRIKKVLFASRLNCPRTLFSSAVWIIRTKNSWNWVLPLLQPVSLEQNS